jgi:hypothetical protein
MDKKQNAPGEHQEQSLEQPHTITSTLNKASGSNGRLGLPEPELPGVPIWPKLDEAALIDLPGEFVAQATLHSEADPAAVLLNLLPFLGAVIGPGSYVEVGDDKHPPRLSTLTVGATSRGRKGTGAGGVKKLAKLLPEGLRIRVTPGPLSSGEGLIYAVRDPSEKLDDNDNPIDPGVPDKRLFVLSPEFASALKAMRREGNTLATIMRSASDDGDLDPLTKSNRIRATGAHICITSHITREELLKTLDDVEIYSGTMNRYLLGCVRRSRKVSNPKPIDEKWLEEFVEKLGKRLTLAQNRGAVVMTEIAAQDWDGLYDELTTDEAGIVGALTSRSEALAIRVVLLYALLDDWKEVPVIDTKHLKAALAIIQFSRDSAKFIFGNPENSEDRDELSGRVLTAIGAALDGLTQTELNNAFNRNVDASKLSKTLEHLQSTGKVTQIKQLNEKKSGRPPTKWKLTAGFTLNS